MSDGDSIHSRPPRGVTEKKLAAIWSEVLGREITDAHASFFDLGDHSLVVTRPAARIAAAFGVDFPLGLIFEHPTIAGLARVIEELAPRAQPAPALLRADPARAFDPFPLTETQQAFVVGRSEEFDLGAVGLHFYVEFEPEQFDPLRAEAALRTLIQRHPMLRAVVHADGTQQVLERTPAFHIGVLDLRGRPAPEIARAVEGERERMSHQVFDLAEWPWFEVRAFQLDEGRVRLFVSYDAAMVDVWSAQLLVREFTALMAGEATSLPPLDATFRDYVLAEAASRDSEGWRRAREYWSGRLAHLPPPPALPMARAPESILKPRFVRNSMSLPPERWSRFKKNSAACGVTPGVALIAAFSEILARWSQSGQFTLSLPIFSRAPVHPAINQVVGHFTSISLLAVDMRQPGSFESRAQAIRDQLWRDLDHRAYNGVQVARDFARVAGGRQRAPIVTANIMLEEGFQSALPGRVEFALTQTPQVLLDLLATLSGGSLALCWDANAELFPGAMLEEMFESFRTLVSRLADDQAAWNAAVPRASAPPAAIASGTAPVSGEMLHTLFLKQLPALRDEPAVIAPSRTLNYGELHRRASRIGQLLRESGVKPNTLVAIVMDKGWEQVAAALGILYSGAAYLPIEAGWPGERVRHLLRHGEVKVALTQSRHAGRIDWPEDVRAISVDAEGELEAAFDGPAQSCGDLAYVIYTSGSAGLPKGVMTGHRGAVNTILDINRRFRVTAADRVFGLSSLGFDLSVYDIFGPLAAGGAIVLPAAEDALDPAHWAGTLMRGGVTIWNSVPALLKLFAGHAALHPETALEKLRLALLSGDWIPLSLPDQVRALAPQAEIVSLGGATEASIWSILFPIHGIDPAWKSIPYGRAMANQSIRILDEALNDRPAWAAGDLYIGGIGLAKGYWRDPEKTAASFIVHPSSGERLYRTGDLGRRLPDGNIEFLGRADFQVKIQGLRIELEEIEAALNRHPGVSAAAVAAWGERDGPKRLVGYIVPKECPPEACELREFLLAKLPEYMVPLAFVPVEALPLTPNGKVDRSALPRLELGRPEENGVAPRDPIERKLAAIWQEVFGLPGIGVRDDFFRMGGHSLLAMQIVSRIAGTFGKKLPVAAVIQARNIERLSIVLRESEGVPALYSRIPLQPRISRTTLLRK